MNVTVIGAGVIGLTSAIRLREAGFDAHIVAADPPAETAASAVAGAIWYPHGASQATWSAGRGLRSLDVFTAGAQDGLPGLVARQMVELTMPGSADPWWADPSRGFRRCVPDELRAGYEDGYVQETVAIDTLPHLHHLGSVFQDLGGTVTIDRIDVLDDVLEADRLVVNCSGVGAGELVGDATVEPIRGQVVRLRSDQVTRITMVDAGPLAYAYIMPHRGEVVVGGTRDYGEWDRTPDGAVTAHLLDKAAALEPVLAGAEVIDVKVGLRPGRPTVRLEHQPVPGTLGVIHNYGHAGNGWSLSWGCADEVVRLARDAAG
jgi:D-amino-acid oxidase